MMDNTAEESVVRTKICHMKLHESAGQLLVDIAREKAYETGCFNDGITCLFASGIDNYDICEKILKGKLTLTVDTDDEGYQVFNTIADSWKPPEPELSEQAMCNAVNDYCCNMQTNSSCTPPAFRRMLDQQELAYIEVQCSLLRELAKVKPREAYRRMLEYKELVIDESNERAQLVSEICRPGDEAHHREKIAEAARAEAARDAEKLIEAHKQKAANATTRAKKHLDYCGDTDCRFCLEGKCCFGGRTKQGCVQDTPELEMHLDTLLAIANIPELASHGELQRQAGKQFNFMFEGHEYTYADSARDQTECPHCGARSVKGHMIDSIKDDEAGTFAFLGFKKLDENQYVLCFECLTCFKHLFYHTDYMAIMRLLEECPKLEDMIKDV